MNRYNHAGLLTFRAVFNHVHRYCIGVEWSGVASLPSFAWEETRMLNEWIGCAVMMWRWNGIGDVGKGRDGMVWYDMVYFSIIVL